ELVARPARPVAGHRAMSSTSDGSPRVRTTTSTTGTTGTTRRASVASALAALSLAIPMSIAFGGTAFAAAKDDPSADVARGNSAAAQAAAAVKKDDRAEAKAADAA